MMATNQFKKINERKADAAEVHRHNLAVMMPFIKFGVGAMKMIASTLVYIVKHIPKPGDDEKAETKPGGRIIKIK
jgi:hypothetical protein